MKKPIIFSVLFFILTAISSFAQGDWIEETIDPETNLRTGKIEINGKVYEIKTNGNYIKEQKKIKIIDILHNKIIVKNL